MNLPKHFYTAAFVLLGLAYQWTAFGESLEAKTQKARHWLVNDMRQKVDSYFKDIPYYLNVDLIYDAKKLESELVKIPAVGDKPLPGLSQMNSTVLREFEIKNLEDIDILKKVDSVVVKISINRAFSETTRSKVETFFRSSLSDYGFTNLDISIISAKIDFETKPLEPEALLPGAERNPVFASLMAMALLVISLTGFVWMMIRASRQHASRLSTSLKETSGASMGAPSAAQSPIIEPLRQIAPKEQESGDRPRREQIETNLKQQLAQNPKLTQLISSYLFQSQHHAMSFVLLGLLKEEHRSQVLSIAGKEQHEDYLTYLREEGYQLASNDNQMTEYMESIYKMVLMGQQDPESLFGFFIRDSVDKLTAPELSRFMIDQPHDSASDLLQILGTERTADLISAGVLKPESVGQWIESSQNRQPDFRSLFESLSLFVAGSQDRAQSKRNIFMSDVGSLLPLRAEQALYQGSSEPMQAKLSRLTEIEIQKTIAFVNQLPIGEAGELIATLDDSLVSRILMGLPDIKSNRIKAQQSRLTKRGRLLKQSLVESLKQADEVPASNSDPEIRFDQSA